MKYRTPKLHQDHQRGRLFFELWGYYCGEGRHYWEVKQGRHLPFGGGAVATIYKFYDMDEAAAAYDKLVGVA
jgi:hypothetical protein